MSAMQAVLRWLGAFDPAHHLVLVCDHEAVPPISSGDAALVWDSCLHTVTASDTAQLLVQGAEAVHFVPCSEHPSQCQDTLKHLRNIFGDLLGAYKTPRRAAHRPRVTWMAHVQMPRRALLPVPSDSALTISASNEWRSFEAFHELTDQRAIVRPAVFADTDRVHMLRCSTCSAQVVHCQVNQSAGIDASQAFHDFSALCPACQVAVHYCPAHTTQDEQGAALLAPFEADEQRREQTDLTPCTKCHNLHPASEGALCALCTFRMAHPFDAAIPRDVWETFPEDVRTQLRGI